MKIVYRPEIDGLRAIAVIAVILYHAQIIIFESKPFKGGFIGVDIFFVISGYLITSIILKELVSTGTFSFKYFYERRIRRILPVLLLVMLASLPVAYKYIQPYEINEYSDWYLPSFDELKEMYFSIGVGSQLGNVGNFAQNQDCRYWSSSAYEKDFAWVLNFTDLEKIIYADQMNINLVNRQAKVFMFDENKKVKTIIKN